MELLDSRLLVGVGVSAACVTGTIIYSAVRRRGAVRVNCWFCNVDSEVAYGSENSWDCPYCDQYNGFSQDGGYNKEIAAQSCEQLNSSAVRWCTAERTANSKQSGAASSSYGQLSGAANSSLLCELCSRNQQLKIKQLGNFQPYDESRYDEEVTQYSARLERLYRLCASCETRVNNELTRQHQQILNSTPDIVNRVTSHNTSTTNYKAVRLPWYLLLLYCACVCVSLMLLLSTLLTAARHTVTESLVVSQFTTNYALMTGIMIQVLSAFISTRVWRLDVLDIMTCLSWILSTVLVVHILSPSHIYSSLWLTIRALFNLLTVALTLSCLWFKFYTIKYVAELSPSDTSNRHVVGGVKSSDSRSSSLSHSTRDSGLPDESRPSSTLPPSPQVAVNQGVAVKPGGALNSGMAVNQGVALNPGVTLNSGIALSSGVVAGSGLGREWTPGVVNDRMRMMRLGTPNNFNNNSSLLSSSGVFSLPTLSAECYDSSYINSSPGDRPLVSPARFNPTLSGLREGHRLNEINQGSRLNEGHGINGVKVGSGLREGHWFKGVNGGSAGSRLRSEGFTDHSHTQTFNVQLQTSQETHRSIDLLNTQDTCSPKRAGSRSTVSTLYCSPEKPCSPRRAGSRSTVSTLYCSPEEPSSPRRAGSRSTVSTLFCSPEEPCSPRRAGSRSTVSTYGSPRISGSRSVVEGESEGGLDETVMRLYCSPESGSKTESGMRRKFKSASVCR